MRHHFGQLPAGTVYFCWRAHQCSLPFQLRQFINIYGPAGECKAWRWLEDKTGATENDAIV